MMPFGGVSKTFVMEGRLFLLRRTSLFLVALDVVACISKFCKFRRVVEGLKGQSRS